MAMQRVLIVVSDIEGVNGVMCVCGGGVGVVVIDGVEGECRSTNWRNQTKRRECSPAFTRINNTHSLKDQLACRHHRHEDRHEYFVKQVVRAVSRGVACPKVPKLRTGMQL